MKELLLKRNEVIFTKTQNIEKYNLIKSIISNSKWPNETPVDIIFSILVDLEYSDEEIKDLYRNIITSN